MTLYNYTTYYEPTVRNSWLEMEMLVCFYPSAIVHILFPRMLSKKFKHLHDSALQGMD
jgi:hypothetical protein